VIDRRTRIATAIASLGVAAISGPFLTAQPTYAKPSIKDVQTRVNDLYHQAEIASERYNNSRDHLQHARSRLQGMRDDLARQQKAVATMRRQVADAVVAQSEGQGLSSASQVMLANNPNEFIHHLVMASQFNDQRNQLIAQFASQAKRMQMRQADVKRSVVKIAETKRGLAADKAQIEKKAHHAKKLLDTLKTQARRAAARARAAKQAAAAARAAQSTPQPSRSSSNPPVAPVPASGKAATAVNYAMAQIGDAYVYGAAGPDAWDCSGLTMMAWRQAGVSLPHSSSAQQSYGTPVSSSNLQPGDLVFYYSPVSHVGMYIGHGKIVNAENPSVGVTTAPLFMMPYSGAVRPG
jgi:cell wall-associated NlpC family hydrolase